MRESKYSTEVRGRIENMFPGSITLKNDSGFRQGIPDVLVLWGDKWAMLEIKAKWNADTQPNQEYYVDLFNNMSFAAFLYPGNEQEVLDALQQAFRAGR